MQIKNKTYFYPQFTEGSHSSIYSFSQYLVFTTVRTFLGEEVERSLMQGRPVYILGWEWWAGYVRTAE